MFGNNRQLKQQIAEQTAMIQNLISEVKALQTHLRFVVDDTDAIRNDLQNLKSALPEVMQGQQHSSSNWKVERF